MFPPTVGIWFTNQGDEVRARIDPRRSRAPRLAATSSHRCPRFCTEICFPIYPLSQRQVFKKLKAYYEEEPYPTQERMEELAEEFGAPDWTKIDNFFKNMQLKHQEQFQ